MGFFDHAMIWTLHNGATAEWLGFLPEIFDEADPRPAKEQIGENYSHGGGWQPLKGFTVTGEGLSYPDDPPLKLIAEAKLHDETIRMYDCAWVTITQPDGTFEACRMD